ncbi:hypothetical protein ACSBR1_012461 [Camellia fascicularis]
MAPRNLYDLFTKFGVVKDVFIPQKRRKETKSRFGFVRYDCYIATNVAEQKANGLWIDDKSLSVKIAARSFAEVIKGDQPRSTLKTTIRVEEMGNGWLYESIIMRLRSDHTILQVKNKLIKRGEQNVLVREGGFLAFLSKEDLMSKKSMFVDWFHDWCEYITVWSPGMHL